MGRCGRVVVIGHPETVAQSAQAASASAALLGFVKSLSKEIGRKGSTANPSRWCRARSLPRGAAALSAEPTQRLRHGTGALGDLRCRGVSS